MEALKHRLEMRQSQIADMKSQIADVLLNTSLLDRRLEDLTQSTSTLEKDLLKKDEELQVELKKKEENLIKLQELETKFEGSSNEKSVPSKDQDVASAYIEFYTRSVQSKPMFKKLPELKEDSEPASPPQTTNDLELDEELDKLCLSDVLKKYS